MRKFLWLLIYSPVELPAQLYFKSPETLSSNKTTFAVKNG